MTELRVYLPIESLARQFAAYMATPMRARGYPPMEGEHSLIIEVAPALAIHRICDLALKSAPDMEPGRVTIDAAYVRGQLSAIVESEDLAKFIL